MIKSILFIILLINIINGQFVKTAGKAQSKPSEKVVGNSHFLESELNDIQWPSKDIVFILTIKGIVYKSINKGKDWKKQIGIKNSKIKKITINEKYPNFIFFIGSRDKHWYSNDMGKTYHQSTTKVEIGDVIHHPTKGGWLLADKERNCKDSENMKSCLKVLMYSKDNGKAFTSTPLQYVAQFDWAPEHHGSPNDVFAVAFHKDARYGEQSHGRWDKNNNLYRSSDFFATEGELMVERGNRFLYTDNHYIFVAQADDEHESTVHLKIARHHKRVEPEHFKSGYLPMDLDESSYTVLDTSEGSIFLNTNHKTYGAGGAGHVYQSDASGRFYTLSLPYNNRNKNGKCDFEKAEGLEGIYIANIKAIEDADLWEMQGGENGDTRSLITFDKGNVWSYINAPQDSLKSCVKKTECWLHLHGATDVYGPIYSVESAKGILIGTGCVGPKLCRAADKINTYLSRDAGLTWYQIAKGSHIYEIGDHGGLIVMAYDEKETDQIWYTWDEGLNWNVYKLDKPLLVHNIITEPSSTGTVFLVYGGTGDSGDVVYLDFSKVLPRKCAGHDAPGTENSDYEYWSPHNEENLVHECLLGHKISYIRKKREKECWNPEEFETATPDIDMCPCGAHDFECDYGFSRKDYQDVMSECVKHDPELDVTKVPENCESTYRLTKGYRRIPGDTCVGGDSHKYDAEHLSCPWTWFGHSRTGVFLLAFVLVGIYGIMAGVPGCKEYFDKLGNGFNFLKSKGEHAYHVLGQKQPGIYDPVDEDDEESDLEVGKDVADEFQNETDDEEDEDEDGDFEEDV